MKIVSIAILTFMFAASGLAQSTEFTYQGRLMDGPLPANASYDLEFKLFDIDTGGTELGTQTRSGVVVVNGIFTVTLDFGAQFDGTPRWLEISVKPAGGPTFTPLTPRQPVTSAPHNIRSLKSADSDALGGLPQSGYIQNTTSPQTANFNVSGDGIIGGDLNVGGSFSAPILNADTQFNINGNRVLSVGGSQNVIVGQNAGLSNSGFGNTFVGHFAGNLNTTGSNNSFYGTDSGRTTSIGNGNSFFGRSSGYDNTGSNNSFFGLDAGRFNTTGNTNSFFGTIAGQNTTTGTSNAFFGASAGGGNVTGFANTLLGTNAEVGAPDLQFATAIGANSFVSTSNTIVLGRTGGQETVHVPGNLTVTGDLTADLPPNDTDYVQNRTTQQTSTNFNVSGTGTAGTINAVSQYNLNGNRVLDATPGSTLAGLDAGEVNVSGSSTFFGYRAGNANTSGAFNAFFGREAGASNITGQQNSFFGDGAGELSTSTNNSFFGFLSGSDTTSGAGNSHLGAFAGGLSTTGDFNTFIGYFTGAENRTGGNNTLLGANADLGSANLNFATAIGAGTTVTTSNTVVLGRSSDDVRVPGNLLVVTLGSAGATPLCRNASLQIATCSSPLTGASEPAKAQQLQIDQQRKEIEVLRKQVEALRSIVCERNTAAEVCKAN